MVRIFSQIASCSRWSQSEASPSVMLKTMGRKTFAVGRIRAPRLCQVADLQQRFVHGCLSDRFRSDPGRHRNLAEGGFAVRHAALHDRFCEIDGQSGQPRYRNQRLRIVQQRYDSVARIAQYRDVVVVAHLVAAPGPFDEFEQQPVGDFGDGFGLGGLSSPEQEFLRHRAGLVDGQDEGCAVAPRDTLGVHYRIPLTVW